MRRSMRELGFHEESERGGIPETLVNAIAGDFARSDVRPADMLEIARELLEADEAEEDSQAESGSEGEPGPDGAGEGSDLEAATEGEEGVADGVGAEVDAPSEPWWKAILSEVSPNTFRTLDGDARVGVLHKMNPKSWKATCHLHAGSCVCWVSLKDPTDEALDALRNQLVEWLLSGSGQEKADHLKSARELKIGHGMRVRS